MNPFRKIKPETFLRLGLGAMFAYSGYDIFTHPTAWHWAIIRMPQFLQEPIRQLGEVNYLKFQGAGELIVAFLFLAWFVPRRIVKWVAALVSLEMILILWLVGVTGETFRDFGVLGAALALAVIYSR